MTPLLPRYRPLVTTTPPEEMRSPTRSRRRVVAALALLVAVGVVVAIFLGFGPSSPPSRPGVSTSSSTTTVQRRDLVETDTESGTLSFANPHTVYSRLSGTITWLPASGQLIKPGQALLRVAGRPVILMNGRTPAYRDLGPSDRDGQDILALNRNLVALGFNPGGIVIDDAWQSATTDGVDTLEASLGETETGTLDLGSVVFLPGDQIVSTVNVQLGSQAALRRAAPGPEFVSLMKTGTTTKTETTTQTETTPQSGTTPQSETSKPKSHSKTPTTLAALLALLKVETAQLQSAEAQLRAAQPNPKNTGSGAPNKRGGSPSSSNDNGNGNGNNNRHSPASPSPSPSPSSGTGGGGSATAVLTTSSTRLVATVQLDPSKQGEARVGERVTVEMPSGHRVHGRVSAVSPAAQSSSGNGSNGSDGNGTQNNNGSNGSGSPTTIPVAITLGGHRSGGGLDQASVSVAFAQAKANNVLSVPVTALLATQGGAYTVQEAASPHHLIPVTPGLFAAGYVQISGPGIYPGLEVSDSQG